MRRASTMGLIFALAAFAPSMKVASAQPPAAPASSDPAQRGEALFREGLALVAQQKWAEAEVKFQAVWELRPSPDVAMNLGQTQVRLGKLREGAQHLAYAVRHWQVTAKQGPREAAMKRLEEVRKELAVAMVKVSVAGAAVLVDGRRVGTSPIDHEVFLDPGTRTIEARVPGHEDAKQVVEAVKGGQVTVELSPVPVKAAAVEAPPVVSSAREQPGSPSSSVVDGHDDAASSTRRTAILVAGGATAGAALVAGVVLTVVANGKASDAQAQQAALTSAGGPAACATPTAACEDLESSAVGAAAFSNAAMWSFVGAGAVGAATVIYALVTSRRAMGSTGAAPVLTAGGGGIVIRGAW